MRGANRLGLGRQQVLCDVGRGGYLTGQKFKINSDCNGAANIIRKKVTTQLENISLAKVDRGVLSRPNRYDVFDNLSRSYRRRCEEARGVC